MKHCCGLGQKVALSISNLINVCILELGSVKSTCKLEHKPVTKVATSCREMQTDWKSKWRKSGALRTHDAMLLRSEMRDPHASREMDGFEPHSLDFSVCKIAFVMGPAQPRAELNSPPIHGIVHVPIVS